MLTSDLKLFISVFVLTDWKPLKLLLNHVIPYLIKCTPFFCCSIPSTTLYNAERLPTYNHTIPLQYSVSQIWQIYLLIMDSMPAQLYLIVTLIS